MEIQQNIPLGTYTTLGVGGPAEFFVIAETDINIVEALEFAAAEDHLVTIIGSGSNMLVSDAGIKGLVLLIQTKGIEITGENDTEAVVSVSAGEQWDAVVAWAVEHELWGIENMSAIPGTMGAFAVGNIGAYGQDASQVVLSVEALDIATQELKIVSAEDCDFGYRSSIFNTIERGQYVITNISVTLQKHAKPNLSYTGLSERLSEQSTLQEIRDAVIAIRAEKLPDPKIIGNAGSFFKNPIVNGVKQSAAALIEQAGLKGFAVGGAQISPQHSLIITNTGEAKAVEIFALAKHVRREVSTKTGIELQPEPIFLGFSEAELETFYDLT